MIKTNLLPYRAARKKENIRRQLSVFILFFIFIFLSLVFYHVHLSGRLSHLNDILASKEKELKEYEAKAKEVDEINAQLAILDKKLSVMEQLNKDRMDAVNLMDAMVTLTVKGRMWITNVGSEAGGIKIDGVAIDNKTVAIFMARIEKSAFFTGAVLKDVVMFEQSGLKLKKFTLTCKKAV